MILRFLFPAACFLTALSAFAQSAEKPARHARFLAVGESPPFRQEIRDGIRYELEPPPGSVPPRELVPGFGDEVAEAVTLRLGVISAPVKVPAGEGNLTLRRGGEAPDTTPWLGVKRPESGDFLVYLFRAPGKPAWDDAVGLVVPDGAGTPAGTVRITNLFPQAVRVAWGNEGLMLTPGKSILRTLEPGAEHPFQILVPDASGAMKRYFSGTVTQNTGERGFVTIYRADGPSPRRPLKVLMLREPVAPDAPKKEEKP